MSMYKLVLLVLGIVVVSSSQGWTSAPEDMRMARAALRDGMYAQAIERLEPILATEDHRFHAESLLLLVEALYGEGRYVELIDLVKKHGDLKIDMNRDGFNYWEAAALYRLSAYDEALELLENVPEISSSWYLPAVTLQARCWVMKEEYKRAAKLFKKVYEGKMSVGRSEESWLDWAGVLVLAGEYESAKVVLERLVQGEDPELQYRSQYWLGRLAMDQGESDAALKQFKTLVSDEGAPRSVVADSWVMTARLYGKGGAYSNAFTSLEQGQMLIQDKDELRKTYTLKTHLLLMDGQFENALKLLREQIAKAENLAAFRPLMLEVATQYENNGQWADALKVYEEFLGVFIDKPDRVRALLGKGWVLLELKKFPEAISSFEQAYTLSKNPAFKRDAYYKTADAYFQSGKYATARERYLSFVEKYPKDSMVPQSRFQAALCLVEQKEAKAAGEEFQQIMEQFADSSFAERSMLQRALIYEVSHDWELALGLYAEFISRYPDGAYAVTAHLNKGLAQYRLGYFEQALASFQQVKSKDAEGLMKERAQYLEAWATYLNGDVADAVGLFEGFLEAYPKSLWAEHVLFWLGEYNYNQGEFAEARKTFARVLSDHPKGELLENALYWAGRCAMHEKEYVAAIELFKSMAEKFDNSRRTAEALFWQGDALTALGEFDAAILVFDELIKEYPDSYLVCATYGRKGDCHYTLSESDQARYDEALKAYRYILDQGRCGRDLSLQATYKVAKTLSALGQEESALSKYQNVVYEFLEKRDELSQDSIVYFSRAAFDAAKIYESREDWRKAIAMYKRVRSANVPGSEDAEERMQKIRIENLIIF